MATEKKLNAASEALVAMPLPKMLELLGLAVAHANNEMAKTPGPHSTVMTVQEAEVEINIAISVDASEQVGGEARIGLKAFSVNASYARTFGFKEEASSRIRMKLVIAPPRAAD